MKSMKLHIGIRIGLIAGFLLLLYPFNVRADELWYQAYDSALKAIKANNWTLAETELKIAIKSGPKKQKKDTKTYGVGNYIDYFPDYYLGLVYYNLGKYPEAISQFQSAERNGLQSEDAQLFAEMSTLRQTASEQIAKANQPKTPSEDELNTVRSSLAECKFDDAAKTLGSLKSKYGELSQLTKLDETIRSSQNEVADDLKTGKDLFDSGKLDQAYGKVSAAQNKCPSYPGVSELLTQVSRAQADKLLADAASLIDQNVLSDASVKINEAEKKDSSNKLIAQLRSRIKKQTEIDQLVNKAAERLSVKQFAAARQYLKQAQDAGLNAAALNETAKAIDLAETFYALDGAVKNKDRALAQELYDKAKSIDSRQPDLARYEKLIALLPPPQVADLKKKAFLAFYNGNYEQATSLFQQEASLLESSDTSSPEIPRAYFYIGCSQTALAFMVSEEKGKNQIASAQQYFRKVRQKQPAFQFDDKYIAPRILEVYKQVK